MRILNRVSLLFALAVAMILVPNTALAIPTVFVGANQAGSGFNTFLGQFYTENFQTLSGIQPTGPEAFLGSGFAYNAETETSAGIVPGASDLFVDVHGLSTNASGDSLLITFSPTGNAVTAFGGLFFGATAGNAFTNDTITITVNKGLGTEQAFVLTPALVTPGNFWGVMDFSQAGVPNPTNGISNIVISGASLTSFVTAGDFTVGQSIPEPATFTMLGGALLGLGLFAKRFIK